MGEGGLDSSSIIKGPVSGCRKHGYKPLDSIKELPPCLKVIPSENVSLNSVPLTHIFAALGQKNKTLLCNFNSVSHTPQLTTVFYDKNIFYVSLCGFVSLLSMNSCFR